MRRVIALVVVAFALPVTAGAFEKTITLPPDHAFGTLKPGDGAEVAGHHCAVCHSTDYIVTQPRGDLRQWHAEVAKMIRVFGAAISPDDARRIADYLARAYGR